MITTSKEGIGSQILVLETKEECRRIQVLSFVVVVLLEQRLMLCCWSSVCCCAVGAAIVVVLLEQLCCWAILGISPGN